MKQQYSLAHLTVLNCSPPEMTYIAAKTGYDYVGFRSIYMGLPGEPNYDLANNKQMLQETKRALAETGIEVLDIELAKIYSGMDPKAYEPAMEVAAELGARHVLSSIWTDDRSEQLEYFIQVCELASMYDLTVELEYVPIAAVKDLAMTLDILRSANQPNAGLMIDVHHFHRAGDRVEDLDDVPEDWFRYVHICDAVSEIPDDLEEMTRIIREERLYLGEGGIDVYSILERMPTIPYSIELPNLKRSQALGNEEHARRCLQSAQTYLNKMLTEKAKLENKHLK